MSLDLMFFKVGEGISIDEVDAYFLALADQLSLQLQAGQSADTNDAVRAEARLAAQKIAGLGEDFYGRLSGNLVSISDQVMTPNAWDLRLGSWSSVGGLNDDLRSAVGLGLEDVFPVAAAWPGELVLPDWQAARSRLRELRDKLVASSSKKDVGDVQLSSLISSFVEVLGKAGYTLPSGSTASVKGLAGLARVDGGKENAAELIEVADAMLGTTGQVLSDPGSRYLLVWSN